MTSQPHIDRSVLMTTGPIPSTDSATRVRDQVSEQEWALRVDLAAAYRLVAHYGWDDLIFTHISARVPGPEHHFLLNPFGMLFGEITASCLVKVDRQGSVVGPSTERINPAGFVIHGVVHEGRADAQCVMHLHTEAGVAVSAQEQGLLPIAQNSLIPYASLAYHDFEGFVLSEGERQRLLANLGDRDFLMLRNHGLLTVGKSVAEAFLLMYLFERACRIQVMAQAGGAALRHVDPAIIEGVRATADEFRAHSGAELAWPGLRRMLDSIDPSYAD